MKAIVLIGVMALVALGIFAVLAFKQCQETDKLAQNPNRVLGEKEREIADAQAFAQEALGRSKDIKEPTGPYQVPSWTDRLQNAIEGCWRAIENLPTSLGLRRHTARLAPPGIYFTLTYLSARSPFGIAGVERGTRVVCVKDKGPVLLVKAGNLEFEAKRQFLTNDLDVADLALRDDAEAQQAIASYIARQQHAIDRRDDKGKLQVAGQH